MLVDLYETRVNLFSKSVGQITITSSLAWVKLDLVGPLDSAPNLTGTVAMGYAPYLRPYVMNEVRHLSQLPVSSSPGVI